MAEHYKLPEDFVRPPKIKLLLVGEAPPTKPGNYFYNVSDGTGLGGSNRSFFREVMRGVGLLSEGRKNYDERILLKKFLDAGYFLIDTCPEAIPEEIKNNQKPKYLLNFIGSLVNTINDLNPDNILFMIKSNRLILEQLKKHDEILKKLVKIYTPLPYPGQGNQKDFRNEFPQEFKLRAIY